MLGHRAPISACLDRANGRSGNAIVLSEDAVNLTRRSDFSNLIVGKLVVPVEFVCWHPMTFSRIAHVLNLSADIEMIWVHAGRIVTLMAEMLIGQLAMVEKIRNSVSSAVTAFVAKFAVSMLVGASIPVPAAGDVIYRVPFLEACPVILREFVKSLKRAGAAFFVVVISTKAATVSGLFAMQAIHGIHLHLRSDSDTL
jgi:hypothetical protein